MEKERKERGDERKKNAGGKLYVNLCLCDQGSSDLPSQLAQATTYIKVLRERVEKLKQRRDECYAKVQKSSSGNAENDAAVESCSQDVQVQSTGAAHFLREFDDKLKCIQESKQATSSEVLLDAPMVATRLRRLLTEQRAKLEGLGAESSLCNTRNIQKRDYYIQFIPFFI
ncbi:uncharacterized protein LOC112890528 [Panicum hallii]|uniref:uncharacterized protein LOC112890528 n=1 Tax=Panicum hallii TaxID=206008 RepID=UPI000DF4D77F|nr:uncharacterized protein LOC112890528 [Panicum hallii]